jgi:hypothetical protein
MRLGTRNMNAEGIHMGMFEERDIYIILYIYTDEMAGK